MSNSSGRKLAVRMRPVGWLPSWRPPPSTNERNDVDRLVNLLKIVRHQLPVDALANFTPTDFDTLETHLPPQPDQNLLFEEVRAWAEEALEQLADTGAWTPEPSSLMVVITKRGPQYRGSREDFAAPYKYGIQQILTRQAWRVSKCVRAKCGKLFIRKGRSEYCNLKCSNAERASRVYAKKKKLSANSGCDYAQQ
jgi:hypothetical protein